MLYALFDEEKIGASLEKNPKYYIQGMKDRLFNTPLFWFWVFSGII